MSANESKMSNFRWIICSLLFFATTVNYLDRQVLSLTYKDFALLCLLCENHGTVLTRTVLMDRIWGLGAERENRTLDVHIRTLRSKLGEAGGLIETVRGIGYRLKEEDV